MTRKLKASCSSPLQSEPNVSPLRIFVVCFSIKIKFFMSGEKIRLKKLINPSFVDLLPLHLSFPIFYCTIMAGISHKHLLMILPERR